jgi:hypothetical protein
VSGRAMAARMEAEHRARLRDEELAAQTCACGVVSRGLVDGRCANCRDGADGSPERSSCCGAQVRVDSGDEGTSCYVCEGCGKPCDVRRGSPEHSTEGEG